MSAAAGAVLFFLKKTVDNQKKWLYITTHKTKPSKHLGIVRNIKEDIFMRKEKAFLYKGVMCCMMCMCCMEDKGKQ